MLPSPHPPLLFYLSHTTMLWSLWPITVKGSWEMDHKTTVCVMVVRYSRPCASFSMRSSILWPPSASSWLLLLLLPCHGKACRSRRACAATETVQPCSSQGLLRIRHGREDCTRRWRRRRYSVCPATVRGW